MLNRPPQALAAVVLLAMSIGAAWGQSTAAASAPAASASTATADTGAPPAYFKRAREGWFWYEDAQAPPEEPKPVKANLDPASAQDRELASLEKFKVDLERAMNAAIQNPSDANVAKFLDLYAEARRKASTLADNAKVIAARMPWIDSTLAGGRPTSPSALLAYDSIQQQDRDQLLREMSRSYGLYFFFRANCAYCHIQAPLLKDFEAKYGFTVYAVSMDGGRLAQYPQAVRDQGLAANVASALGIPMQYFATPAVVLARPSTGDLVPVGFGAMNGDEMAERIASVVRVREQGPGRPAPNAIAALMGQSGQSAETGQSAAVGGTR